MGRRIAHRQIGFLRLWILVSAMDVAGFIHSQLNVAALIYGETEWSFSFATQLPYLVLALNKELGLAFSGEVRRQRKMAHLVLPNLILFSPTVTLFCVGGNEDTVAYIWEDFFVLESAVGDDNVSDPFSL
jgi:hypothetical protein